MPNYLSKRDPRRKFGVQLGREIVNSSAQQKNSNLKWEHVVCYRIMIKDPQKVLCLLYAQ